MRRVNPELIKLARGLLQKRAFVPMSAEKAAQGGMPPGGAPPMDPAMAGGMPPGGAPPMDPAMAGGAPPMDPAMDPAMAGGAPPMDPSAGQGGTPIMVNAEDLMALFQQIAGGGAAPAGGEEAGMAAPAAPAGTPEEAAAQMAPGAGGAKKKVEERLAVMEYMLNQIIQMLQSVLMPQSMASAPLPEEAPKMAAAGCNKAKAKAVQKKLLPVPPAKKASAQVNNIKRLVEALRR